MDLGLRDKVILIAGGSKGLGYGIAKIAAQEGAQVFIGSRSETNIENAVSSLKEETNNSVSGYPLDVCSNDSIKNWIQKANDSFPTIDALVVNSGGPPAGNFNDFEDQDWSNAFDLLLLSSVRLIREVLPIMKKNNRGSILHITSTSIIEPIDQLLLSNVLRSGVNALMKSLSRELAPYNIRINNLVPGRIDTERVHQLDQVHGDKKGISAEDFRKQSEQQIPLQRYGTIEEFGKAAAFLLSDIASYSTGSTTVIDGGKTRAL